MVSPLFLIVVQLIARRLADTAKLRVREHARWYVRTQELAK
jgi:hypothetical protein